MSWSGSGSGSCVKKSWIRIRSISDRIRNPDNDNEISSVNCWHRFFVIISFLPNTCYLLSPLRMQSARFLIYLDLRSLSFIYVHMYLWKTNSNLKKKCRSSVASLSKHTFLAWSPILIFSHLGGLFCSVNPFIRVHMSLLIGSVPSPLPGPSGFGWLLVFCCQNFLKWREVTLSCSYRRTCFCYR